MSTATLRARQPLESLPLAPFIAGMAGPSSPISMPHKRSLTSSPGRIGESSASKTRKVSVPSEVEAGQETIKKRRSEITPRAKQALAEDEYGTGKSPARRLFTDGGQSLGISGATISPNGPSRHLSFPEASSSTAGPSRTLAPSPPISSAASPNPFQHENENGAIVNEHDIGFEILPDPVIAPSTAADSHPFAAYFPSFVQTPPTPSEVVVDHNDQENVPPPQCTPTSTSARSTPSKKSSVSGSACSTASSSRFYDDNDIVNLTGSGRKRVREKSKLNEVLKSTGSGGIEPDDNDELTPGRTRAADKGKGKQKMALEVDDA